MLSRNSLSTTIGIFAGLASAALFSLMALFIHLSNSDFSPGQILLARGIFGAVVCAFLSRRELQQLFGGHARFLWMRALFGGLSVACYTLNLRNAPLSSATILTDLAPLFVAVFSILFLRESMTRKKLEGIAIAVTGVLLLSSPSSLSMSSSELTLGLAGAVFGAWAYISLKKAAGKFSSSSVVFAFSFALIALAFSDGRTLYSVRPGANWLYLALITVTSLLAQVLMTLSYRRLSTSTASTLGLTAIVWAFLFDVRFLETPLTAASIAAVGIVLFGLRTVFKSEASALPPRETVLVPSVPPDQAAS